MTVAPVISAKGILKEVLIPGHRETPVFFDHVVSNGFLAQFEGKSPGSPLTFGKDIDGVTGATISSRAISKGVRQGMDMASLELLKSPRSQPAPTWTAGRDEVLLFLLYAAVLICSYLKIRKARLPILIASLVFLGLIMNRPVSISNMAALFMGHVPDIRESLFWWMLVPGSMALVIVLGKNIYCSWICPFGGIQELITKTGGMQVSVSKPMQKGLKTAAKTLAWQALILAFFTGNAANASMVMAPSAAVANFTTPL